MRGIQKIAKIKRLGLSDYNVGIEKNQDGNNPRLLNIKGPYNDKHQIADFISRNHEYYYLASFDKNLTKNDISNLKWAISYDGKKAKDSFYLFSGGIANRSREVKIRLKTSSAQDKFKLYAYYKTPNDNNSLEVFYKKSIVFFIGGAGDKRPYGPVQNATNIVKKEISDPFRKLMQGENSYVGYYLGYYEVYKGNLTKSVLSIIPSKDGISVFVVGHSLGGWNGAHLVEILNNKGYKIDSLITIDPVGTGNIVTLASDIYLNYPMPKGKCDYWINIRTNPEDSDIDDWIAWGGGQWVPADRNLDISYVTKFHHREAGNMFKESIDNGLSAENILFTRIQTYLDEQ